jgi:hypothetical protein
MIATLAISKLLVFGDAPPCVAYKHNPCKYDPALGGSNLAVILVLVAIVVLCFVGLALIARRRIRRRRLAARSDAGS